MIFERTISDSLKKLATQYPVITLIGPRQSGKTTLTQQIFPHKDYVNLEEPDTLAFAVSDPRAFLERYPNGAILDEIQRAPVLLSYIQALVDKRPEKGLFILTGSHQLALHAAITQSLAGRTALLTLLPLSLAELNAHVNLSLDELLLTGGYPRIYHDQLDPTQAYRNYLQTYIERDVRQLIQLKDLLLFQQFIKLCAGRVGQVTHFQNLSNELGVSGHTIKNWISILEASFIIFQLPPYFENLGKRTLKSPKLYFTDVGLASYLLDIDSTKQIQRDPLRGHLVENLFILEMMKYRLNRVLDPRLYYYRDNHQHEVDVIFKQGHELIPIEIKSAQTFHPSFLKTLNYFQKLVPNRCSRGFLIYAGEQEQTIEQWHILHYAHLDKIFEE